MRNRITGALMAFFLCACPQAGATSLKFLKSQAGPSGRIVDNQFVFDELRNDLCILRTNLLQFTSSGKRPPGNHTLSAFWKDPDGKVVTISPDIKMETKTSELHAYWIFQAVPGMRSGVWTVEIRIDGDELYASAGRSLVWIYKLDESGLRIDTALGFVIAANQVATAFQAIDGAARVELEFSDGRKVVTDQVWSCDRMQDWALLKAATGDTPVLERMESGKIPVGERYVVFNVQGERARVIGGIDITGRRTVPGFGDRIQIAPSPAREAAGGPLLSPNGLLAGIVGGSVLPGSRFSLRDMSVSPAIWSRMTAESAAVPITAVPKLSGGESKSFRELLDQGILTPGLTPSPSLVYGGSARLLSKNANDMSTKDTSEFSHRDKIIWIYTLWQKKEKVGKGIVSGKVYDSHNRLLVDAAPKKISMDERVPLRIAFDFSSANFPAGVYRVDVLWNSQPAWRTFFTLVD